ncbi:hypothetical protein TcWFU_001128 [Taenia crassiceps]|uniref:Uncharacterized protein n=1 Tax=Taenia crassiceps TaxID=6207 RepID=A0ABR4QCQ9_9CEST
MLVRPIVSSPFERSYYRSPCGLWPILVWKFSDRLSSTLVLTVAERSQDPFNEPSTSTKPDNQPEWPSFSSCSKFHPEFLLSQRLSHAFKIPTWLLSLPT